MLKRLMNSLMGSWLISLALLLALTVAAPAEATGVYQMPPLSEKTWVVDDASLLSRINESKITKQLKALAENTGNEVRMVTIHRLDYGETPASFASALSKKWFPDAETQVNQTILVLDDVTNGADFAIGDTSATLLTKDIADSIAQETIGIPLRKESKYNQALLDASDRLIAVLSGETDPGPPVDSVSYEIESTFASAEETDENRSNATIIVIGFLIAATIIPMATYFFYQSMGG